MKHRREGARLSEVVSLEQQQQLAALLDTACLTDGKRSLNEKLSVLCDHRLIKKYNLGVQIARRLKKSGPEACQLYFRHIGGKEMYDYCNRVFKHARTVMKAIPSMTVEKAIDTGIQYVQNTNEADCRVFNAMFGIGK